MTILYPRIEPYEHGMLDVGDGNQIYWEVCGNPEGKPAVVLHGGPGGGCSTMLRRYFDPSAYRIVLFDQRGCGRSTPHAGDISTDLSVNTTEHLLADLDLLRQHLSIDRWLLFCGSWGCVLGLAYAECSPHRVTEIVLRGVALTRKSEIKWLYRGVAPLFPEQWARFREGASFDEHDGDPVEAYYRLLQNLDPAVHLKAAKDWCTWEAALMTVKPDAKPEGKWLNPAFQLSFARLVTHYFRNHAWLEDGELLKEAYRLADTPGVMVHGRLDLGCPLVTAWELAQAWPGSELVVVDNAGHTPTDPGMSEALIAATDRFIRQ